MADIKQPESEAEYEGFAQIGEEDDEREAAWRADPYRVQFNFTGAFKTEEELQEMVDAVVEDAQRRGLFGEFFYAAQMDEADVIEGSPLHQAITGRPAQSE